jgi:4-hydroxy-3-methylbut-2-enyl diphosphate reductase
MPRIKLAENIGFCSGVRRAIGIVEKTLINSASRVYSLGAVIHNPRVINELEEKGLQIAQTLKDVKDSSVLILPSHGSPRQIFSTAFKRKIKLVNVICPYVSLVHNICDKLNRQGLEMIIIGDKKHPEIRSLVDLAPGAHVIETIKDIGYNAFSNKKIGIISQTTQSKDRFFRVVGEILKKNPHILEVHIYNTICLDTARRQEEAKDLANTCDVLLVIGSRSSANTKRLLGIGRKINPRTYLVESEESRLPHKLGAAHTVGIISGASTPRWLVEKIVKKINNMEVLKRCRKKI